eukprot:6027232-Amphidinium_carterae.1
MHHDCIGQPCADSDMQAHWVPSRGYFTGMLYTDGSAARFAQSQSCVASRLVVQLEELCMHCTACALLPLEIMPDQTVAAAELYAVFAVVNLVGRVQIGFAEAAETFGAHAE